MTTYDRSDLIRRAIDTLKHELFLQMVIVSLVILLFLWHISSAIVPILTIRRDPSWSPWAPTEYRLSIRAMRTSFHTKRHRQGPRRLANCMPFTP